MTIKIEWRDRNAYVGPHTVARVYYQPMHAPRFPGKYLAFCFLPGGSIPEQFKVQSSYNDAVDIAELAITKWFELAMKG